MLNAVTAVQEILSRNRNYPIRIAAANEQFFMVSRLVEENSLDSAITVAAQSLARDLNFNECLPALAKALVVDLVRTKLIAALKADLVDNLANDFAKFQTENEALLRAHGAIKP